MKNSCTIRYLFFSIILTMVPLSYAIAQLNGNYTINYKQPCSATNYHSFSAAISDLSSGSRTDTTAFNNGPGVNGNVVFLVDSGVYNESPNLPAITGASDTSTITFDGGVHNASSRIITYARYIYTEPQTFLINGAKYILLKNLTFKSTGKFGYCIQMLSNTKNIVVKNCIFSTYIISVSSNCVGIALTLNTTGLGGKFDSINIDSNSFINTGQGIYIIGLSSNISYNIKITNNLIIGAGVGISAKYINGLKIDNNIIQLMNYDAYNQGLTISYCKSIAYYPLLISNNQILNYNGYGFNFYSCNTGGSGSGGLPALLYNNYIREANCGYTYAGLRMDACENFKIYHNTVLLSGKCYSTSLNACFSSVVAGNVALDIRNNIFFVGSNIMGALPFNIAYTPTSFILDRNNYFLKNVGSGTLIHIGTTNYTKSTYIGGGGLNPSSYNIDPLFFSEYKFRKQCLVGDPMLATTDIEGKSRNTSPTIGVYEIISKQNDIGVIKLMTPTMPMSLGMQLVKAQIYNYGLLPEFNFAINYSYNSLAPVSVTVMDTIPACDTLTVSFLTSQQINVTVFDSVLKLYTSFPVDSNHTNDTLITNISGPLNGTYIIGNGGNYSSINSAINALNKRGISGPVIFNLLSGTYQEQFVIGNIAGVSQINTVTFKSLQNNTDSVTITFNPHSFDSNFVVKFDGAQFINLKHLSFYNSNDSAFGIVINLTGVNSYDSIQFCKLKDTAFSVIGNQQSLVFNAFSQDSFLVFSDNSFINGSYSFSFTGNIIFSTSGPIYSNHIGIIRNTFYNQGRGMNINEANNLVLDSNLIIVDFLSPISCNMILMQMLREHLNISNNKIFNFNSPVYSTYAIVINNALLDTVIRSKICNNVINLLKQGDNSVSTMCALRLSTSRSIDVYNNTFNISPGTTSPYSNNIYLSSDTSLEIKNNIISSGSNDITTDIDIYDNNSNPCINCKIDYNLYYSHGINTSISNYNTFVSNFKTWSNTKGFDKYSYVSNPVFIDSIYNLAPDTTKPGSWYLNGMGIQKNGLSFDINHKPRSTTFANGAPDVGAYEITPGVTTPVIYSVSPSTGLKYFIALGDTLATLNWGTGGVPIPSNLTLKYFPGRYPVSINTYGKSNFVYEFSDTNLYYSYDLSYKYRLPQIGTVTNESLLRVANKFSSVTPWYTPSSSIVDSVNHKLSITYYFSLGSFSATDFINPLPVQLLQFKAAANKDNNDVNVYWVTASEQNISYFEPEFSFNGISFQSIKRIYSIGNSQNNQHYSATHFNAFENGVTLIYYRLKTTDKDGQVEYSNTIPISKNITETVNVFPNPFKENINLSIISNSKQKINLTVSDINGREIFSSVMKVEQGINNFILNDIASFENGIYFLKTIINNEVKTQKLVKVN